MILCTTMLEGKIVWYYAKPDEVTRMPTVWLTQGKRFYVCGSYYLIQALLPKKFHQEGFRRLDNALSYLGSMTDSISRIPVKELRKFAFFNLKNEEYTLNTIAKYNQARCPKRTKGRSK